MGRSKFKVTGTRGASASDLKDASSRCADKTPPDFLDEGPHMFDGQAVPHQNGVHGWIIKEIVQRRLPYPPIKPEVLRPHLPLPKSPVPGDG
jgi:hypothetical protein